MLSANKIFKKVVNAKDCELGIFVNLVFDGESKEARMVVFPKPKDSEKIGKATKALGSIGSMAVSTAGYGLYDVIGPASKFVSDATNRGARQVERKLHDKKQELGSVYFLVPVSDISSVEKEDIQLGASLEDCEIYRNMIGTSNDLAFFNDEFYVDLDRFIGISLNLTAIRGLNLEDEKGKKGRILDINFEPNDGLVTHLIVKPIGKDAKPRLVSFEDVDLGEMVVRKKFEDYPMNGA